MRMHQPGAPLNRDGAVDVAATVAEFHEAFGLPAQEIPNKLDGDGKPLIRDDGKVLKSDRYFPPDIEAVLSRQAG